MKTRATAPIVPIVTSVKEHDIAKEDAILSVGVGIILSVMNQTIPYLKPIVLLHQAVTVLKDMNLLLIKISVSEVKPFLLLPMDKPIRSVLPIQVRLTDGQEPSLKILMEIQPTM